MKKLLICALVGLGLLSCTKDGDKEDAAKQGSPATIKISITGNSGQISRAGGSLDSDNVDSKINNYTIFFFRADGSSDRAPITSLTGVAPDSEISVTTALSDIYVVANASAIVDMSGIVTKNDLVAFTVDMDNAGASSQVFPTAADGTGASVYQVGKNSALIDFGTGYTATADIVLKFLPARIKVVIEENWSTPNTGNPEVGSSGKYVDLTNVVIANAKSKSFLFAESSQLVADAPFYAGINMDAFANVPGNANSPTSSYQVMSFYDQDITSLSAGENAFFYLFENSGAFEDATTTFPVTVFIFAKFYDGTPGGKSIYFPARFDGNDINYVIEPGKAFTLTLSLKGNPVIGGGGTDDPSIPIVPTSIDVTITPASWATIGVNKEFN